MQRMSSIWLSHDSSRLMLFFWFYFITYFVYLYLCTFRVLSPVFTGAIQISILLTYLLTYFRVRIEIIIIIIKLFANDTKIWNRVNAGVCLQILQQNLECVEEWCDKWLLKFSSKQCYVMHICDKSDTKCYFRNNDQCCEITAYNLEKDLGIWLSYDIKWSTQCSKATKKAILAMIKITFAYLDLELHNTCVRAHL